jgi:glycyl-tRNA synthetase beta chain
MPDLLFEIGTEEIPAGYIAPALEAMAATLCRRLEAARIEHGPAHVYGTPRRLTVLVEAVAKKQTSLGIELQGPPARVAFDKHGRPAQAAIKFAEKAGIPLAGLRVRETEKGSYVFAVKREKGLASRTVLKAILPQVIAAVPFPKSMRWGDLSVEFARPILHLVALWGASTVGFEFAGLRSGRYSRGHQFMHPGKLKIQMPTEYVDSLRRVKVYADPAERKAVVQEQIEAAAASAGGTVLRDDELLDTVANLTEYPVAVVGSFDRRFLDLPEEVLITAMREHQKYFALVDAQKRLMPHFIAVNNTRAKDMQVVAKGHERVLRARLEDAKFFYAADLAISLEEQVGKLKSVTFQARLGSIYAKVQRLEHLVQTIAETLANGRELEAVAGRAAHLCKTDLVTQMVGEFPKLQGVMGRVYAIQQGESQAVATAVEEHYRPTHSGAALPATPCGALLSIADKMDTLCACFCVGLIPTGGTDPYALRRQGIGILQIMQAHGLDISLSELIRCSLELLQEYATEPRPDTMERVKRFLKDRLANLLAEQGHAKDTIAAVLDADFDVIPEVYLKIAALEDLKRTADFEPIAVAFKRVVNIIRKAPDEIPATVQPELFEHEAEASLLAAVDRVQRDVTASVKDRKFDRALGMIASLREPVDSFFDGVLVMADEPRIRRNRLAILKRIATMFDQLADFSKL